MTQVCVQGLWSLVVICFVVLICFVVVHQADHDRLIVCPLFPPVPQRNHTGSNTHHDYSTRMMMMLTHASNAALLVVGLLVALVSAVEGMFTAEMVG